LYAATPIPTLSSTASKIGTITIPRRIVDLLRLASASYAGAEM
jgi:hypothetical protein